MYDINHIKSILNKLTNHQIEKNIINLHKHYSEVEKEISISDDNLLLFLVVENVIPTTGENGIEEIIDWTKDDLEEDGVVPILSLDGGNLVVIGVKAENKDEVFYFDYDFGLFKLDNSIQDFINKLSPPIDFDNLTDEEWDKLSTTSFWLSI